MYFEVLELYQEDCPNITITERIKDLNIFIIDVLPIHEKERLKAYLVGNDSKGAMERLSSLEKVSNVDIYSKSKDIIETRYDIEMTRAWKIVHEFGGRVIGPIIVHDDTEKWFVVWDDMKKRRIAIEELGKTDLTKVKKSYEIKPDILSRMFLNIELIAYMIEELCYLTPTQLKSLEEAYLSGFYDVPRRSNLGDLASKVGISKTAYIKRLKSAEKRIIRAVLRFLNSTP